MAMSGDMLGIAIGTAFYNAIPGSVIQCMKPEDRVTMCNTLIQNSKNSAGFVSSRAPTPYSAAATCLHINAQSGQLH